MLIFVIECHTNLQLCKSMAFWKVQIFIGYKCKVVFKWGRRKLTAYFMVVSLFVR